VLSAREEPCPRGFARRRAAGDQHPKAGFACPCFPGISRGILWLQLIHVTELRSKMSGLSPTPIKEKWFINQCAVQEQVELFINLTSSPVSTRAGRNGCCRQNPFDGSLAGRATSSVPQRCPGSGWILAATSRHTIHRHVQRPSLPPSFLARTVCHVG